jgi:PAS domain S-box-containing protein
MLARDLRKALGENPSPFAITRLVLLIGGSIGFNIGVGYLVKFVFKLPLFLDAIGTILVGALLGPLAGAVTGVVTNVAWSGILHDSTHLPFAITSAFIGWAAGNEVSRGIFKRFRDIPLTGLWVGIGAALISAPISAYIFGGITGIGTDYLIPYLEATGSNILQATTVQGFLSDPLDKILSFTAAWLAWNVLRKYFPQPAVQGASLLQSLSGYSLAVVVNLLALLLSFVFIPAFGRGVFAVFYLTVLLTAWRGGLLPAILSTGIGLLANIFFLISPFYNVGIIAEDWMRLIVYILVSGAIAVTAHNLEQSRQELQRALRQESEIQVRLRALMDGVDEAMVLFSPQQRFVDANKQFYEFFGVPDERVRGQLFEDLRNLFDQVFADPDKVYQAIAGSRAEPSQSYAGLVVQQWPARRDLQLLIVPIWDKSNYLGRLFLFHDVTREREASRLKDEFVSLVSHELRTPLTSIQGYTEMVLDGDAGEINAEAKEYLGIVNNNTQRLVGLVNDLLDLSRIESGRIQLKNETVNLNEIVQIVVNTMQQKLEEKGQDLAVKIDPGAVTVRGDRNKLVQVLTNYVSNAYKYTPAGGKLWLDICPKDQFAQVSVKDNGMGISPEDQAKLFTRFFRVDNSMTREIGGTGLGLSIVKQLVHLQGGDVWVESQPGQGSTFYFTIPLANGGDENQSKPDEMIKEKEEEDGN